MEFLNITFFEALAATILVCVTLTALTCIPPLLARRKIGAVWHFALAVAAFSMLGFVTGQIMSLSREPAVAAVVPAALTLVGGLAVFIIGSKGVRNQAVVSALILNFSLALFIGGYSGAVLREQDENAADREVTRELNRHAADKQRLLDYVELIQTKHNIEEEKKIDLSGFQSTLERKAEEQSKK